VFLSALAALLLVLGSVALFRLLALMEGRSIRGIVRCLARGRCEPLKQPQHDGFRCVSCGRSGADMGEFLGFDGAGHVPPVRRVYDRRHNTTTRTVAWEKGRSW
jgi:hypothetical protein